MKIDQKKINEVLERGVDEIINKKNLEEKLISGKVLRIKLGIDPTSPNLHLGRSIPLLKLRDFQNLGHKIIFIIGDFTGLIGDTSDKESERPMLSKKDVEKNLKTYINQVSKIIDINKAEIYHNSKWLDKLRYIDIGQQANIFSLNEFISRENIKKRLDTGKRVSLRELLYPLMQGYDSVMVKADVEIGGTDQRFNLLAGRDLQKLYGQKPQDILTNPIIEGLDGRKMSSSFGNTVNLLDSPNDMFGKIMSLKDEFIIKYFILLTRVDIGEIEKYKKELERGLNPRDIKINLATEIVRMYHSGEEAKKAQDYFINAFSKRETPKDLPEIKLELLPNSLFNIVKECMPNYSNSEIRRLITQGGVKINGEIRDKFDELIDLSKKEMIVKIGKKNWFKVLLK